MFQHLEARISEAVRTALTEKFQLDVPVGLEQPKQSSFGELAIPVAFQLARQLRKAPRQIAEELLPALASIPGVAAAEIAGNGFINVRLDRPAYAQALLAPGAPPASSAEGKIVVEHTNINPNKAAHIGHLRNAILGDTFVRMLRHRGRRVEVQNYIDNTGVQVADVVAGFYFYEHGKQQDMENQISDTTVRFDYWCWDLYTRTSTVFRSDPEFIERRSAVLQAIEEGTGELAAIGRLVADTIVRAHLATMLRLEIQYDLLPRESEILHLQFWATAFELLKQRSAIYFEEQGKNTGCWVMPSSAFRDASEAEDRDEEDSKVIVRSNGTVTYVGKDIAYQLWKFGLLGKDFFYRTWSVYPDGRELFVTTSNPQEARPEARFGRATRVYNVIDSRQSYLQDVVVAGLRALQFNAQAEASVHFSYEMVALTPRTCLELGITLSEEDRRRPYVEVSGRKGLGVKADDLIDKLVETALAEVVDRHPDKPAAERETVAQGIAIGALRYFMLKFTRNSVIAFDFHEALSFEGETGPYVQYAAVRATRILSKWEERSGPLPDFQTAITAAALERCLANEGAWQLLLLASKADHAVERALASGEPAHVAKYAFQLAQAFNNFYHEVPVLTEEDSELRTVLLWLTSYVRDRIIGTLGVLGIRQPSYM